MAQVKSAHAGMEAATTVENRQRERIGTSGYFENQNCVAVVVRMLSCGSRGTVTATRIRSRSDRSADFLVWDKCDCANPDRATLRMRELRRMSWPSINYDGDRFNSWAQMSSAMTQIAI